MDYGTRKMNELINRIDNMSDTEFEELCARAEKDLILFSHLSTNFFPNNFDYSTLIIKVGEHLKINNSFEISNNLFEAWIPPNTELVATHFLDYQFTTDSYPTSGDLILGDTRWEIKCSGNFLPSSENIEEDIWAMAA